MHALLSLLWLASASCLDNDAHTMMCICACQLQEAAVLALKLVLRALQACQPQEERRCKGAPPACISVPVPCSVRPEQAAACAVQSAPLLDDGLIKLTARATHPISDGYHYRLELCARTFRLPAAVSHDSKYTRSVGHKC